MSFMEGVIGVVRGAGEKIPVQVSKIISTFVSGLDTESQELITGLQFKLDEEAPLIGGRGIPTTPFVVNPKLFELTDNKNPDPLPSDVLGLAALKLIQFPMIEYRSRIITKLGYTERLEDPEIKDFFDGLVEFGCYLHLVQAIRSTLKDSKASEEVRETRKLALTALSHEFSQMEGYQPLSRLVEFSLSDDEGFPARMELALNAASAPFYKESSFLPSSLPNEELADRRYLAHKFTQKLIIEVGGVRTASHQELGEILRQKLENAKGEEEVVALIAELAALENLSLNPFANAKPQSYEEWIDFIASKDRWESFGRLSPSQQFELLMRVNILYDVHKAVDDINYLNPLFDILRDMPANQDQGRGVSVEDLNYLISLALQLPDSLESLDFTHDSVDKVIRAMDFFEAYAAASDTDIENVRQMLDAAYTDLDIPVEIEYDSNPQENLRLKLNIKDLSQKFSRGELEPIDVLKILQLYISSDERVANPEKEAIKEYPTDLTSWLKYVIEKGHTHSFGAFAGRGVDEHEALVRINEFAELLKETLPLYAMADNLREWETWQDHMSDPLVAAVTLIAFESRLDVLNKTLQMVKERALIPGDIFNVVFMSQDFDGLPEDMVSNVLQFRNVYAERANIS